MTFYSLILLLISHNPDSSIITQNLEMIFRYFAEEEQLHHQKIGLRSSVPLEVFTPILKSIQEKYPTLEFSYTQNQETDANSCQTSINDLDIDIPAAVIRNEIGKHEYSFRSHFQNIYGTLTFELSQGEGQFIATDELVFATVIGYDPPQKSN